MRRNAIVLFTILSLSACAGTKQTYIGNIHDGLAYSQMTYKRVLEGFAEAQLQGQITDEQMENVIRIGREFQRTHNLVITLVQEYLSLPEGDSREALQLRITALSQSLNAITQELIILLANAEIDDG